MIGLIYTGLLIVGVVYALLTTVFGWFADHDLGFHTDGVGDAGQPHPVSGTVVATFITGFGGGGSVAHYLLKWSLLPGLLAATVAGLVLAGAAFAILDFLFSRTQAGSEFATIDVVGRVAEVITPIPAEGTGEIAYQVKGQREILAARALSGAAIAKGRLVEIENVVGATAFVRLKP